MFRFKKPDFTNPYGDFPKLRKKTYLVSILFFSVFVSSTFFIHTASAVVSEGCGLWDVNPECDLSGWMKLLMGDIGVGAFLAVLLHVLAHRSKVKLEENGREIQKIVESQESIRKARRDYAIQNIKNHMTTLLFVVGILNRLIINYNSATEQQSVVYGKIKGEEERMARIIQNMRNTIVYSSDTLDPTFVNQLDGVCTFVGQSGITEKDGKLEFPKYEKNRRKIDVITKKLQSITEESPVFK